MTEEEFKDYVHMMLRAAEVAGVRLTHVNVILLMFGQLRLHVTSAKSYYRIPPVAASKLTLNELAALLTRLS